MKGKVTRRRGGITLKNMKVQQGIAFLEVQVMSVAGGGIQVDERQETGCRHR